MIPIGTTQAYIAAGWGGFHLIESLPTRTVTFDLAGGIRTGGGALTQQISYGGAAVAPTVTREGYNFIGWDLAFNNVTANITVTAQWARIYRTVTFNLAGGIRAGGGALTQEIPHGSAAVAPTATREGYNFTGWDRAFDNVTANITVTAQWTRIQLPPPSFPDTMNWSRPYVLEAYDRGIIIREIWCNTHNDYIFRPSEDATRAMAADFIWRTAGAPAPVGSVIPFTDVTATDWFADAVLWAHENNIIRGRDNYDGTFRFAPDDTIERRELSTMLMRLAGDFGANTVSPPAHTWPFFADHGDIGWAEPYIRWNFAVGLLLGDGYRMVHPQRETERAEALATVVRFARRFVD